MEFEIFYDESYSLISNFSWFSIILGFIGDVFMLKILTGEDWNSVMYVGIQSWGGLGKPMSVIAIVYFVALVIVGNCILQI